MANMPYPKPSGAAHAGATAKVDAKQAVHTTVHQNPAKHSSAKL